MAEESGLDRNAAHRYFSAHCFNLAWELLEKTDRTPAESEEMIATSHASIWHWMRREDCSRQNMSIGYWQLARIYATVGQADNARRYGELSLEFSSDDAPFFKAYAYEALARAEYVAGNFDAMKLHVEESVRLAELVPGEGDRDMILKDLKAIG